MSTAVVLPPLGESVAEGTIAQWLVKEGDRVERDQPLVEVTTDKVDVEIPSPCAGIVARIVAAAGEVVPVGAELARIETATQAGRPMLAASAAAPVASAPAQSGAAPPSATRASAPRATPLARRVADALGVDLSSARASGPGGRVSARDVQRVAIAQNVQRAANAHDFQRAANARDERAADAQSAWRDSLEPQAAPGEQTTAGARAQSDAQPARSSPGPSYAHYALQEGDRVTPMSPLRRLVAEHMVFSKATSPHVGTVAEIDLGGVVALRERHQRRFSELHGFSLSYLPFVVCATARALREFPALNASVIGDAIVEKAALHLGIAVETENGLIVPVVRHADRLSLTGLAVAIQDLASRARSKRLSADELRGGTFTISNPGRHGNLYGFAIINQPQVAILRLGEIAKRAVVRSVGGEDAIAIRPTMHLALSYDHRAVDGVRANGFLHRVRELLESADFEL
jgi:pyruvate/2-oxoglutarate dehydrogenase complex dihydrolipoamide acyltransferase (E2) component